MPNGIIIVDKPAGWTSQDVAAKLRGVFSERRVGHGGTLDPLATGVLPVFVGRATRAVEFFTEAQKQYEATLQLGLTTDTQDVTGTVLTKQKVSVAREELERVLEQFLGPQQQIPPMYSAIKIGGKKLYELARTGKAIERPPRRIEIFALELLEGEADVWRFRVTCSRGTYVRTLCADIGAALGCGGCMQALRRTQAGDYTLAQALTMEQILNVPPEERAQLLLPVDSMFAAYPALTLTENQMRCVRNGAKFTTHGVADGTYRLYSVRQEFLALGKTQDKIMSTVKSFFDPRTEA